jgi:hypothetical protein
VIWTVIAAAEPSKVPFYIAGGVLALWAVVLSWLGLTRPDFPFSERGQRGVMSVSLVLVVIAIGAAIATS